MGFVTCLFRLVSPYPEVQVYPIHRTLRICCFKIATVLRSKKFTMDDLSDSQASKGISKASTAGVTSNENSSNGRTTIKLFVGSFLLSISLGVIVSSVNLRRRQQKELSTSFSNDVVKLQEGIGTKLTSTFGAIDSLGQTMQASMKAANMTWPFLTVPFFAEVASRTLSLTPLLFLQVYPLVPGDLKDQYLLWASENDQWVADSIEFMKNDTNFFGPIIPEWITTNYFIDLEGQERPQAEE